MTREQVLRCNNFSQYHERKRVKPNLPSAHPDKQSLLLQKESTFTFPLPCSDVHSCKVKDKSSLSVEDELQKIPVDAVAKVEGKQENNVSETFDWSDQKRCKRCLRSATCRQRSACVHNGYKKAKSE